MILGQEGYIFCKGKDVGMELVVILIEIGKDLEEAKGLIMLLLDQW